MMREEGYLHQVQAASPGDWIVSSEFNAGGQNSDVLVVNGDLIFRFPKYPHVLEQLEYEVEILRAIQGRVPLAVPVPSHVSLESQQVGQAFVGYRMVPGDPLWRETFQAIQDQATLRGLASQLGGFLKALHSVPYADAIERELPLRDTRAECEDIYRRMRDKLFGHMRPDAHEWASEHFEAFLRDDSSFAYEPVLKHGDFGPSNILFDKDHGRISGIIDFGGSGLGDPAYDFAGLLSGYGEEFVRWCGEDYPEVELFLPRIRFYRGTFALLEALFGVENGDEQAFRAGIAQYA